MDLYKCIQVHSHKKADEDQYILTSWIIFIYHIEHNTEYRGGGGGTPHMKGVGMLVVLLRGVNFRFWSHLGCSGQNAIKFSHEGLI